VQRAGALPLQSAYCIREPAQEITTDLEGGDAETAPCHRFLFVGSPTNSGATGLVAWGKRHPVPEGWSLVAPRPIAVEETPRETKLSPGKKQATRPFLRCRAPTADQPPHFYVAPRILAGKIILDQTLWIFSRYGQIRTQVCHLHHFALPACRHRVLCFFCPLAVGALQRIPVPLAPVSPPRQFNSNSNSSIYIYIYD
jgi:hypothetical protein